MIVDLNAATDFIHSTARLLDRHRLAHLRGDAGADPVVQTLRAYHNPDGGFGHAIEPDMRAPVSQPVGVHTALEILHEVGAHDGDLVRAAADWLTTVTREDGGIPFCLPSALDYPRNPIWQPADESSIIQTAANAAALHALDAQHPWLEGAGAFVWRWLGALDFDSVDPSPGFGYEIRFAVGFLNAVPDGARADAALDRLAPRLFASGVVSREPGGDVQTPLDLAPLPNSRARRMFSADDIERDLDALEAAQHDDGGWMFAWDQWNAAATLEWRGVMTIRALRLLAANSRL